MMRGVRSVMDDSGVFRVSGGCGRMVRRCGLFSGGNSEIHSDGQMDDVIQSVGCDQAGRMRRLTIPFSGGGGSH